MIVRDVQNILEQWVPQGIAWERDNVGLQVGDSTRRTTKILVTLDVNSHVVREALDKRVDLILSHHPLLFHPPKYITPHDRVGKVIFSLIQNDIAVYSLHTNFDFTLGGVSFALAEKLELKNVSFLDEQKQVLRKLTVFVPPDHVDAVAESMASAGAGLIGKYEQCSFRVEGKGTFRGGDSTKPFVGKSKRLERVNEIRLEMIVPKWSVDGVVRAMRKVHPYEEVAYDVYVLDNESVNYGAGAIGELQKEVSLKTFLQKIKRRLKASALRYAGNLRRSVKRVAVCGGSGSNLLDAAIRRGADAFVTADVKYHAFEAADDTIALIDAGHFETEHPSLDSIVQYLRSHHALLNDRVQVMKSSINTNPIHYY